jgi:hypothetical protein
MAQKPVDQHDHYAQAQKPGATPRPEAAKTPAPPDPVDHVRTAAANRATEHQDDNPDAAMAKPAGDDTPDMLPGPEIVKVAAVHPTAMELLGKGAEPTGALRLAMVGSTARLQHEWAAGDKAVWVDVPQVAVDSHAELPVTEAPPALEA